MIPQDCCIRCGCWLNSVRNLLPALPLPKFTLGQQVKVNFEDEDGCDRSYQGLIVGVFVAPIQYLPGWWYVVRCHEVPGCDWLTLPYDDECHEEELELLEAEMPSSALQQ